MEIFQFSQVATTPFTLVFGDFTLTQGKVVPPFFFFKMTGKDVG